MLCKWRVHTNAVSLPLQATSSTLTLQLAPHLPPLHQEASVHQVTHSPTACGGEERAAYLDVLPGKSIYVLSSVFTEHSR